MSNVTNAFQVLANQGYDYLSKSPEKDDPILDKVSIVASELTSIEPDKFSQLMPNIKKAVLLTAFENNTESIVPFLDSMTLMYLFENNPEEMASHLYQFTQDTATLEIQAPNLKGNALETLLEIIPDKENVKELIIENQTSISSLDFLNKFPNLERLSMTGFSHVTDLAEIAKLEHLHELNLTGLFRLENQAYEQLSNPNLMVKLTDCFLVEESP